MKGLKIWGWLLVGAAVVLWAYGWISGEFNGHGIARMDNIALTITILSVVCLLLGVTVGFVVKAMEQMRENKN